MEMLLQDPKIWVAVAFVLFFIGFIKLALPVIINALDERSAKIKEELQRATKLREDAQTLLEDYQRKQKEMLAEAERILKMATDETHHMRELAEKDLHIEVERRTKLAHAKIARLEADAVRNIRENMVDIATDAANHMIEDQMESSDEDELMDVSMDHVQRIVH